MKSQSSIWTTVLAIIFIGGVIALGISLSKKQDLTSYKLKTADPAAIGPADAKVTVTEYFDFQCPACQQLAHTVLPALEKQYANKVKFVYKQFPLPQHKEGRLAAIAIVCAQDQDKFSQYRDKLVNDYPKWASDTDLFEDYAKGIGLDLTKFKQCREADSVTKAIDKQTNEGLTQGVNATPTLFINNEKMVGVYPIADYQKKIDALLK